jgi:hypothetical protein
VQPLADPDPHQLVPGGVELDLVDAAAEAVVGAEGRLSLVRLEPPADHLGGAADGPEFPAALLSPAGPLAAQRLAQWAVGLEGVEILQRRRLVEDLMGLLAPVFLDRRHE